MKTRKLNLWFLFILVPAIALVTILFGTVSDVYAGDGDPPPTQDPDIVGGTPSTPGEWPWQVALIGGAASGPNFRDDQFCGGSLIHPQWVLTAAHCITDDLGNIEPASSVDVIAGIYNLASPTAGFQRRDVTQIIRHPDYVQATFNNDIALLRLASPINLGGSGDTATALVPLVPWNVGDLTGSMAWVTGWGNTQSVPAFPNQLHEVQLPVMANSVCNDANHYSGNITGDMLCAGYDSGGFDACQGDSGGPLVVENNGRWKLAGVISWGAQCAAPLRPGVYARISQYGDWINQNIGLTTLVSPSGPAGINTPTYTWNAVNTMTHYYLWVDGSSGNVIKQWYTATEAGCSSGIGTCSVTPSVSLSGGAHTWWIQTWNEAGYGPWTNGMSFSTPVPPLPAKATLTSPNGTIGTSNPTYTWNQVNDSTWYYLWVDGPSGNIAKKWYSSVEANCNGTTCSITNATPNLGPGAYTWSIQTYNSVGDGPWSDAMTFSLALPGSAILASPTGSIVSNNPTYTWNKVSGATWYYLWVDGPSGNTAKKWYTSAEANCNSTTCSVANATPALGSGAHKWWIQTWNEVGYGSWSSGMTFTTPLPPLPAKATLQSPSGSIDTKNPTYTWNQVNDSTWYYLWVVGPSGDVINTWYTAAQAGCNGSTCSITGATPDLSPGSYTWKVQTYNSAGNGPLSDPMAFSLALPGQATLLSPTGSITNNNPTYTWNKVSNATWYYLWVDGPSSTILKQWYAATSVCGASTCSVPNATPNLGPGAHKWWIQTYNSIGDGPWSPGISFSTPIPWPAQPTLISPNTTTTDLTPTFSWNAVSSDTGSPATWYYLWVNGPSGEMIKEWYTAAQAGCTGGTGTCSITPSTLLLPEGTYTWWVRGYNASGDGPWSTAMSFAITNNGGFNSQFNGVDYVWSHVGGNWQVGANYLYATAVYGDYSNSVRNDRTFSDFDFSARMYRSVNGCEWCDNSLYVRGNPGSTNYGYWQNGYQFTYANDATFSVWKAVNGTWYLLQGYTYTPAIAVNDWNVLRVVAYGNGLYYYINGSLVWSGTDNSFSSGYVGLEMYTPVVDNADVFYVDWATLSSYTGATPVAAKNISVEQQALNDTAKSGDSQKIDGGGHK